MLTRLKLTRGEGQLVEPNSHPSIRKIISSPQASRRHSPSMAHEESHEHIATEDEDLRKAFMEMREMMKLLMEERNTRLQGEGSNPSKHKGDSGDKTPNGNGGNDASPPPSAPSSSYSYSSTRSRPLPNSPKGHGKTPSQIPLLKLDIKFELPMYNGAVNTEKLDNWICQIEVYCRIQKIQDDETKIQLASLRLDSVALIWWEAKTQEDMKKHGKISTSWNDFIVAIKKQFYPLAYMQKATMDWQNFRQAKGKNVQIFTQEFRRRALVLGVYLSSQETLLKYIGALHSYLRHTILMFNPSNLDEVCVQATHLEERGRNETHEGNKKPFSHGDKRKRKFKGNGKKNPVLRKREKNLHANIVQKMAMMKTIVGNFILKEDPKSLATKGSQRLLQPYNMI
jgi:hypothetical protein